MSRTLPIVGARGLWLASTPAGWTLVQVGINRERTEVPLGVRVLTPETVSGLVSTLVGAACELGVDCVAIRGAA